jgi:hypothetical protein
VSLAHYARHNVGDRFRYGDELRRARQKARPRRRGVTEHPGVSVIDLPRHHKMGVQMSGVFRSISTVPAIRRQFAYTDDDEYC